MEHRLVVLPAYQGLGIGTSLSDEIARRYVAHGQKYVGKTAHPKLATYRERRPERWRQHGKFSAQIDCPQVHEDGTATLSGPALGYQAPSCRAMVWTISCKDNAAIQHALVGQNLHSVSATATGWAAQVPLEGSIAIGAHTIEGKIVFYRQHQSVKSPKKDVSMALRGLGLGGRLSLLVRNPGKGGGDELVLQASRQRRGRPSSGSEMYRVPSVMLPYTCVQTFKAVAALTLSGEGAESEEANAKESFRRLIAHQALPSAAAASAASFRAQHGELAVIKKASHMRLTFSHEFIVPNTAI